MTLPLHFKNPKVLAVLWIVLCKFSFIAMMVIVKAQISYPTLQLNFFRGLMVMAMVAPFLLRKGKAGFKTRGAVNQFYRVFFGVLAMCCIFYAYRVLHLSKVSALEYSYGLVLPLLAVIFLKEKVAFKRWLALILGYVGIWVIVDPMYEKLEVGELIILIGVLLKAAGSLHLKKLTNVDAPLLSVFYSGLATSLFLGAYFCIIPYFPSLQSHFLSPWQPVDLKGLEWILLMGLLSFIAQYSYIQAFCYGRLNFLSGFEYLKIIFATLFGFVLFAEVPTWQTLLGGLIVLSSSYLITRQEFKRVDLD